MNQQSNDDVFTRFDETAWIDQLARIKQALPNCGCNYELFDRRFTAQVDEAIDGLAVDDAARALHIATCDPDYFQSAPTDSDDDSCPHGFNVNTCPCGCGG